MKKMYKVSLIFLVIMLLSSCGPMGATVDVSASQSVTPTLTVTMVPTNTPTITITSTPTNTPTVTTTPTPTEVPVATLAYTFPDYDLKLQEMTYPEGIVGTPDPNVVITPNYVESHFGKSLQLITREFYGGKALYTSPCTTLCYEVTGECFPNPFIVWDSTRPDLEDQCYLAFPHENVKGPVNYVMVILNRTFQNKSVKVPQALLLHSYQSIPVDFSDGVSYEELIEFEEWSNIANLWDLYNIERDINGQGISGSMEFVFDIIPLTKAEHGEIHEYMDVISKESYSKDTYGGLLHFYIGAYIDWPVPFSVDESEFIPRP